MNTPQNLGQTATRHQRLPARRSTRLLLGALAAVSAVAVFAVPRFWHRDEAAHHHGGAEGAVPELEQRLASTPQEKQFALLVEQAGRAASPGMRYAAVDQLGERKDARAADALENGFRDNASQVRQRVVEVLPNADAARGQRLLLAALNDDDTWIREAAASQIALRIGRKPAVVDRRAVPALVHALDDPNPTVRVMSAAALRKLTGNRWQPRRGASLKEQQAVRERWRRWWKTAGSDYRAVPPELARPVAVRPVRADPAPDFRLPDVDGREISRSGQRGRITLLNFWGTWCPPCQQEVPDLVKIDARFKGRGVDLIGIALGEKDGAAGLRKWTRAHNMEYRQALAADAVLEAFDDIEEVPVSILLDGNGQIRYRWEGERDFDTFRAAIDHLLSEKEAKR